MDEYNNEINPQNTYQNPPPPFQPQPISNPSNDKVNIGFCILGWFIPLFGFIYYFSKKSEKPKGAKAVGIVGLVSFILNIIITCATIGFMGASYGMASSYNDNINSSTSNNSYVEEYNYDSKNNEWKYDDEIDNYDDAKNYIDGFADRMGVD